MFILRVPTFPSFTEYGRRAYPIYLALLQLQSRFEGYPLKLQVVGPQNETALYSSSKMINCDDMPSHCYCLLYRIATYKSMSMSYINFVSRYHSSP